MPRVQLIEQREHASESQLEAFDHIAATRGGRMVRPFAAMLHRPEIARAAADLGAVIRFESTLSDHDRELAIVTTAIERNCEFEWQAHRPLASAAGVSDDTLDSVAAGGSVEDATHAFIVDFVRSLCRSGRVDDETFQAVVDGLSETGAVELAALVGYYSMLAIFMNACDAC